MASGSAKLSSNQNIILFVRFVSATKSLQTKLMRWALLLHVFSVFPVMPSQTMSKDFTSTEDLTHNVQSEQKGRGYGCEAHISGYMIYYNGWRKGSIQCCSNSFSWLLSLGTYYWSVHRGVCVCVFMLFFFPSFFFFFFFGGGGGGVPIYSLNSLLPPYPSPFFTSIGDSNYYLACDIKLSPRTRDRSLSLSLLLLFFFFVSVCFDGLF